MIRSAEVLVVGAGPAGIAAATAAATHGRRTILLDDNTAAGGQIWREPANASRNKRSKAQSIAVTAFLSSDAELLPGRRVVDTPQQGVLSALVQTPGGARREDFEWDKLILATGARERFLPFPGWTLPGVFGVGGLEALVKGGFPVSGKRVVIAGTGPLLLAVGSHLRQSGAEIVTIAEQAPRRQLLKFLSSLAAHPSKLFEGARLRVAVGRAPFRAACWVVSVDRNQSLRSNPLSVQLTDGKRTWSEQCDLLACGFNLVPKTELAALLGCTFQGDFVQVDREQQTSLANVLCAGEPTTIGGLDAALMQGTIAGLVAAGELQKASALFARRDKQSIFARNLESAFRLRPELRSLPGPDTIVCRCEDVRFSQLQGRVSWTDAKLATRCGMGPCQGRVCGPAVQTIFGWQPNSVRPPLFPVPLSVLSSDDHSIESESETPQEMA